MAFDGLQKFTKLRLQRSKIQTLENKRFAYIPQLNSFDLSISGIQCIETDAFTETDGIFLLAATATLSFDSDYIYITGKVVLNWQLLERFWTVNPSLHST